MPTYILSQASQLARLLKPGDRVVLALNDSPSLACLFLACIAVGAIPAVINPKSREQALADIAADCQASLVVREADAPSLSGPLAPLTLRAAAGRPLLDDFSLDALVGPATSIGVPSIARTRRQPVSCNTPRVPPGRPRG